MGRFWAIFFLIWAIAALVFSAVGPYMGYGFPGDGRAYSTIGVKIDHLFYVILGVVVVVFIGTHVALVYTLWKGAVRPAGRGAVYSHGNNRLEVIWTAIPAVVLLFLSIYQMNVWAEYRVKSYAPRGTSPVAELTARQFEWRIRYPAVGKPLTLRPQPDDLYTVNDLRVPVGEPVSVQIRSDDVQHAFFVPQLRLKQDVVPGLVIPVWFEVTKPGEYEFVCAELCGWGHYKMRARLVAMPTEAFTAWRTQLTKEQSEDGVQDEVAEPAAPTLTSLSDRD